MSLIKKMARKILFKKNLVDNKVASKKPVATAATAETPSAAQTIATLATPSAEKKAYNPASERKPGRPKSQSTGSKAKSTTAKKPAEKKKS